MMIVLEEKNPSLYGKLREVFDTNETNKLLMINGVPLTSHSFSLECNHGTSYSFVNNESMLKELKDGKPSGANKVNYTPYYLRYDITSNQINILNKSFKKKNANSDDIISDYLWDSICDYLAGDDIDNYFDSSMYVNGERPVLDNAIEIEYIKEYNIIHLMSPEFKLLKDLFNSFNYLGEEDLSMNFTVKGIDIYNTIQVKEILSKSKVKAHLMKAYTLIYHSIFAPSLKFDRKSLFVYSQAFCPVWYHAPSINLKSDVYKYIFNSSLPDLDYITFIDDKLFFNTILIDSDNLMNVYNEEGVRGNVVYRTHKDICKFLKIKYIPFTPSLLFVTLSKTYMDDLKVPIYFSGDNIGELVNVNRETGVYVKRKKNKEGGASLVEVPTSEVRIVNQLYFILKQEYKTLKVLSFKAFDKFKEVYNKDDMPLDSKFNYPAPAIVYNFYYKQLTSL